MIILEPNLTEKSLDEVLNDFGNIIQELDGKVIKREKWGKRRLAYRIKKQWYGNYVILYTLCTSEALKEFERRLRFHESVIKFMSVVDVTKGEATIEEPPGRIEEMPAEALTQPVAEPQVQLAEQKSEPTMRQDAEEVSSLGQPTEIDEPAQETDQDLQEEDSDQYQIDEEQISDEEDLEGDQKDSDEKEQDDLKQKESE